jgi:3-phenylpropionate/trans-cinnamate dioxygenase ferredoxin subunit
MTFIRACGIADVPPGSALAVDVQAPSGNTVAVVHTNDDECSHAAIPLSEGDVEGCEIECWLHGSRFDLRTGKPTGPPASEPVTIYPVRVDGDDVLVDVANPLND